MIIDILSPNCRKQPETLSFRTYESVVIDWSLINLDALKSCTFDNCTCTTNSNPTFYYVWEGGCYSGNEIVITMD
jgi:hypothetical protein